MSYPVGRPRRPVDLRPVADLYEIPAPPAGLTPLEHEAWAELREIINAKGVATAGDMVAFKLMIQALATARRAYDALATSELVERGEKMDRPSPLAGMMATQQKLVWHGLARFGLTPADRSRVKGDGGSDGRPAADPEDEFA